MYCLAPFFRRAIADQMIGMSHQFRDKSKLPANAKYRYSERALHIYLPIIEQPAIFTSSKTMRIQHMESFANQAWHSSMIPFAWREDRTHLPRISKVSEPFMNPEVKYRD